MSEPAPTPVPRRRSVAVKVLLTLSLVVILVLAVVGAGFVWVWRSFEGEGPSPKTGDNTVVMLERGDSVIDIGLTLEEAGVISDATIFRFGVLYNGATLKAGEYRIPAKASMHQIMDILASGKGIQYSLTIPEGLTSAMILRLVQQDTVLEGDAKKAPAEGTLLPETYSYTRGMARTDLLKRMAKDHAKLAADLWKNHKADLPYDTLEKAIIIASIVEKETGLASERPQVASVFVNRLRKHMKLQSDPTIIYGLTGGEPLGHGLTKSELDKPNPYNTYQIDGLPPTPICNPGRASLEAVMNPPDTDYLFFVATGNGGHVFAATLDEHAKNVAKLRAVEKDKADADAPQPRGSAP